MAKVDVGQVVPNLTNNLNQIIAGTALDAVQGNVLKDKIENNLLLQFIKSQIIETISPGVTISVIFDFSEEITVNSRIISILPQANRNQVLCALRFYSNSTGQVYIYVTNNSDVIITDITVSVNLQVATLGFE